ncbi:hypothetical protein M0R45_012926 [Rubus argutus]|uniref:Uncharacterized protein n=1 Tax=Rubus argutus TaxID=59490 RepID=A0AAW1XI21_RUBAR
MNQRSRNKLLSSPDLPMKRKRGRPHVGASDDVEDEMVGQMVSGVIEGSFDAGYLLNVRRKEIPIPAVNLQSHLYGSARPSEQNDAPALGGKVIPQQSLEPGSQSTHLMAPSENDVVVEQDKVLEEVEPTTTMTGPNGVEVNKESKTETSSEPIGDIPCIETLLLQLVSYQAFETVCKSPQIEPQAVATEKRVNCFMMSSVILGVETVCKDPHIQPEDVSSEKSALVQDVVKSLNVEPSQTPPVFAASDPTSEAVENLMEEEAYSASKPSQMFGEETVASEGSIPSGVAEPHISTSSGAVDNMECDIADAHSTCTILDQLQVNFLRTFSL